METDTGVPSPPDKVDPIVTVWRAGRRLYRVHPTRYGPNQFNLGTDARRGRFHPIRDAEGLPIPTLYAADRVDGTLSETIFHNVVAGGMILRAELTPRVLTRLELRRDIKVAGTKATSGMRGLRLRRNRALGGGCSPIRRIRRWHRMGIQAIRQGKGAACIRRSGGARGLSGRIGVSAPGCGRELPPRAGCRQRRGYSHHRGLASLLILWAR